MARKPPMEDVVLGNCDAIMEVLETIMSTTRWLEEHAKIPVARLGPLWIASRSRLLRAKEAARKRGEEWAQPREEEVA